MKKIYFALRFPPVLPEGFFNLQQEEKNGYQDICYCSLSYVFGVYSPEEVY